MELTTIEMPAEQAAAAFKEYRHAVRSAKVASVNSEDAQIARAYKALAQGKQVVNINDAFEEAGYGEDGLPRLAISRADYKTVAARRDVWANTVDIGPEHLVNAWRQRRASDQLFTFRAPPIIGKQPESEIRFAVVPNIPPHLRPPFDLTNYHLLWEAKWLRRPRPPGDPALLKHLGGPLYAVLAVWDLTPVEQAVLSITRTR